MSGYDINFIKKTFIKDLNILKIIKINQYQQINGTWLKFEGYT